jgi:16S rRNA (guanine966-N2)-methyltransferase
MSLRIVSGLRHGFKLFTLPGLATRPMGERARQAVFNVLTQHVPDARVLDLFAGSGVLGLEALSRGAASTFFIDSSPDAISIINRNIDKLSFSGCARVLRGDALRPASYAHRAASSDVIFVDPPYEMVRALTVDSPFGLFLADLSSRDILAPDGIMVLGHHRDSTIEERFGNLVLDDRRNYGINGVAFFRLAERVVPPSPLTDAGR